LVLAGYTRGGNLAGFARVEGDLPEIIIVNNAEPVEVEGNLSDI
jgi:hypothetical protein